MIRMLIAFAIAVVAIIAAPRVAQADNILDTVPDHAKGMFLVITGSGSALPDPQRGGASAAVVIDGQVLQFDFGRGVMENELRAGISPRDIDYVFLTHHHFDHIGELDYYMMSMWVAGRTKPVEIYGPVGTKAMIAGAYAMHELDVGFIKGVARTWPAGAPGGPSLKPPYKPHDCGPGLIVKTDKFTVTAVLTPHLPNHRSMAFRVDSAYGSVVISGDTGYSPDVAALSKGVDILVHETQLADPGMVTGGKFDYQQSHKVEAGEDDAELNKAHSTPSSVGRVGAEAKPGMIILTHLAPYLSVPKARALSEMYNGDAPGPQIWDMYKQAVHAKYSGPVVIAEDGMVLRVGAAPKAN